MYDFVKVGIVGVGGYTGRELLRILKNHPHVRVTEAYGHSSLGKKVSEIHPAISFEEELFIRDFWSSEHLADVYFICVHHGKAQEFVAALMNEGKRVIDLSADFRLKDKKIYEEVYQTEHKYADLLSKAVYGMPEIYRSEIEKADLIANPGCLSRASILSLYPVLKEGYVDTKIAPVIDAKTGVSGAGKGLREDLHFPHMNENFKAYSPLCHRHEPEIVQELSKVSRVEGLEIVFVPHLLPIDRGIFVSTYFRLRENISASELARIYADFYKSSPFVEVLFNRIPELKEVRGTNRVKISAFTKNRSAVVFVALDNLLSGASGTAVHNMNLMFGIEEAKGLHGLEPLYP